MKSLNVKRIAALAAGAAMLGASLAVAGDVSYSNVPIIQNGQPRVKIVVGEKAAASDGVAAANIAAMIGNLAYKSQAITATISGEPTCTVAGGTGSGTCAVSDEKATLEVTVPGTVSGAFGFKTLINDMVDRYLENRNTTGTSDTYNQTTQDLSPFCSNTACGSSDIVAGNAIKKVSGGDFSAFATFSPRDSYAGKTYTEEQTLWVRAKTKYDTTLKKVVANSPYAAYKIEFTHADEGIPAATCTTPSMGYYVYSTGCATASDQTERHRVMIKWLGEDWIISSMTPPGVNLAVNHTLSTNETAGGADSSSINLAKESAYGIIHIGENLSAGAYTVKLADITVPMGTTYVAYASIQIFDSNGVSVKEDQAAPGSTYTWSAPDGTKVRIRVYSTNPGYTMAAKWAEMAVYSQEITLESGKSLDQTNADGNKDWYVSLVWRNKDPSSSGNYSGQPDSLRKIILKDYAVGNSLINMQKGDTFNIPTAGTKFQLSFDGLNLADADKDTLAMTVVTGASITAYVDTTCATTNRNYTNALSVSSGLTNAFTLPSGQVSQFYFALSGASPSAGGATINTTMGDILYKPGSSSCYVYQTAGTGKSYVVQYNLEAGSATENIYFHNATYNGSQYTTYPFVNISESAGMGPAGQNQYDYVILYMTQPTTWQFNSTDKAYYIAAGPANDSNLQLATTGFIDEGYVTERGSQFVAIDTTGASLLTAKKVAEAQYYVKTTGAETTSATTITLAEGETSSGLSGGVIIKAKSISETVGACTAGGVAPTCTAELGTVTATPSVSTAVVSVPVNPVGANRLVVLDNEATGVANLVVIGGPGANAVAKAALTGADAVDFKPDTQITKVVGNKIIIAGYGADQTAAEAEKFIAELATQRA